MKAKKIKVQLKRVGSLTCAVDETGLWVMKPGTSAVWSFRGNGEASRTLAAHGYVVKKSLVREHGKN